MPPSPSIFTILYGPEAFERRLVGPPWPRRRRRLTTVDERRAGVLLGVGGEQAVHERRQLGVGGLAVDERRARVVGAGQRRFEQLLRRRPTFGGHLPAPFRR